MQTSVISQSTPAMAASQSLALDDLLDFPASQLESLYKGASAPRLDTVRGDLRGRMLAAVQAKLLLSPATAIASADWFPWRGKSFQPETPASGTGINRIFSDRFRL